WVAGRRSPPPRRTPRPGQSTTHEDGSSMNSKWMMRVGAAAVAATLGGSALAAMPRHMVQADFADNAAGWSGPAGVGGATFIDPQLGDAAPALHTQFFDFGITFSNTQARWLAALTHHG